MSGIFICYRRAETQHFARALTERLTRDYSLVFIDVDAVDPGEKWVEKVEGALQESEVLIAVIGRQWLTIEDENGKRRLDNPMDRVRLEIETALQRDILVVPVLVDGAVMPSPDVLPGELKKLTERQAFSFSHSNFKSEAKRLVESIRGDLLPQVVGFAYQRTNPLTGKHEFVHEETGLEFTYVEGGQFTMGSPEDENGRRNNETQHGVTLSPYLIAKHQITQEVWEGVMGGNPSGFRRGGNYPVEKVSWDDVADFCRVVGLKLPTEAQWEFAARAGTTGPYPGVLDEIGWYKDNSGGSTHMIGEKQPNAWGLYDTHGNVHEWCEDEFGAYPSGPVRDPIRPDRIDVRVIRGSRVIPYRVIRGGCWANPPEYCRSAFRSGSEHTDRSRGTGFRPAGTLKQ